jgi:hypothetical protein
MPARKWNPKKTPTFDRNLWTTFIEIILKLFFLLLISMGFILLALSCIVGGVELWPVIMYSHMRFCDDDHHYKLKSQEEEKWLLAP